MAKHVDLGPATVQRIWAARGLEPHLIETFELSGDSRFEKKLTDVVGLHPNPPENAMVLCMDERSRRSIASRRPGRYTRVLLRRR